MDPLIGFIFKVSLEGESQGPSFQEKCAFE